MLVVAAVQECKGWAVWSWDMELDFSQNAYNSSIWEVDLGTEAVISVCQAKFLLIEWYQRQSLKYGPKKSVHRWETKWVSKPTIDDSIWGMCRIFELINQSQECSHCWWLGDLYIWNLRTEGNKGCEDGLRFYPRLFWWDDIGTAAAVTTSLNVSIIQTSENYYRMFWG